MKNQEVEIKLSLAPNQASSFRRSTLLRDHKTGRAKTATLVSTYFDTPTLMLRQNGMALRIRRSGHDREQTLKWAKSATAGLQSRTEFNTPLKSDQPDLDVLDVPELVELRGFLAEAKSISPIFASHIKRTTWVLNFNGSQIEVALDEGEVRSGKRSEPVSEIELELIDGEPIALVDLAMLIAKRLDVCPEVDSKAGRGYALYRGEMPGAKKVKPPNLSRDTSIWVAFQGFMYTGIKQLLANRSLILDGKDPEGVHQGRVAVRRMRAALSSFRPILNDGSMEKARTELRWMQQELGPARDWDVFLEEAILPLANRVPDDTSLKSLIKVAERQKVLGYERAWALLKSRRFATSLLWLERWLLEDGEEALSNESIPAFASKLLNNRRKKVRKKAGEDVLALPEATLHELRIELKKLRYSAQLFKSMYPQNKTQPYLERLSAMQDCLGGLNDAAVQQELLDRLKEAGTPVGRSAQSIIAGWHASHTDAGLAHLDELWTDFADARPFWR